MAIFCDGIPCPLCGEPMADNHDLMGLTYIGFDDPIMAMLDDATFHRSCFMAWEHRDRFIATWNGQWPSSLLDVFNQWRIYLTPDGPRLGFDMSLIDRFLATPPRNLVTRLLHYALRPPRIRDGILLLTIAAISSTLLVMEMGSTLRLGDQIQRVVPLQQQPGTSAPPGMPYSIIIALTCTATIITTGLILISKVLVRLFRGNERPTST